MDFLQGYTLYRFNGKASATSACKLARCVVSASAAASGQLTRPDDGCRNKSAWQLVQCAAVLSTPTQGGGSVGRGTPRPARRLSFHILSSPVKKEYGPRRAIDRLSGRDWLAKICKFGFKVWRSRVRRGVDGAVLALGETPLRCMGST